MRNVFASDVDNVVNSRNVYPEMPGGTTGTRGSAMTTDAMSPSRTAPYVAGRFSAGSAGANVPGGAGSPDSSGGGNGIIGHPVAWWVALIVLLVALMWGSQRFGSEGENFKNIKLSVYNIVVISLAAVIGFAGLKMIFARFQVPGLSDVILAA
jgi:hypothetical protein